MMKQLFDDPLFQMFTERALMTMTRGGAEYGEVAAIAARVEPGDADSWHEAWTGYAAKLAGWAEDSHARGHQVSAREAEPGQGGALIEQQLRMRPDWEVVLRAVVDAALAQPEVDGDRIAVMGWSFGGWLAPRAASGEPRIAALIADPGQWDQAETVRAMLPPPVRDRYPDVDPAELEPMMEEAVRNPMARWKLVQRGMWVHGAPTLGEYVVDLGRRYRLSDVVGSIECPTLVAAADGDPLAAGAEALHEALNCPKTMARFTAADGAAGHCEGWNRSRFDQVVFDWLDETLQHGRSRVSP